MTKFSPVDQFHDPSFKTLARRIREVPDAEVLFKTAQLDATEVEALPDGAFADPAARLFPMHTPEHAALSYLYASDKTAGVQMDIQTTLRDTLDVYGVQFPVEASVEKVAAAESLDDYLLPERKRWKVSAPEHVKLAEAAIAANAAGLSVEERAQAAVRLVKKAAAMDVDVTHDTLRKAGMVASDLDTVREWVEVRCNLAPIEYKAAFAKIAMALESGEGMSFDREALVKLASTIATLDKEAGLADGPASSKLYDPLATVFNTDVPIKLAGEQVDLGSVTTSGEKLAQLPVTMFSDVFGPEIVRDITTNGNVDPEKVAMVVNTMPLDLKTIFAKQARGYL